METGKFTASDEHLVLVVPGFPKDEADTQCIPAVHQYALVLARRVRKLTVVALHYPYSEEPYEWHGVHIIPLNGANSKWKRQFTLYGKFQRALDRVKEREPFAVMHALWLNECGAFTQRYAQKRNIPYVLTAPGQDALPDNRYLKKLAGSERKVYCLSHFQTSFLRSSGFQNVEVIEWGTHPVEMESERPYDLIIVSSLIPLKNVRYFVTVCEQLKKVKGQFRAVIVGGGPEKALLQQAIVEKGLQDCIEMKGTCSYEESLELIARSKVLIHCASYEGFGMVHIEALAAGLHVLSTPVGIAFENEKMQHLTLDPEKDALKVKELLALSTNEPYVYDMERTVSRYLEVFEGL